MWAPWMSAGATQATAGAGTGEGGPRHPRGQLAGAKGCVGRLRTFTNYTRTGRSRQFCGLPLDCAVVTPARSLGDFGAGAWPHRTAQSGCRKPHGGLSCIEADVEVAP